MLDERTLKLLKILNSECQGSGYKVFSFSELQFFMPEKLRIDENEIRESLRLLSNKEYVSVKYEDETEVCLSVLLKGRLIFEKNIDNEIDRARNNKTTFLSAFFGAFFGGIVVVIVAVLFFLFGGR
ncbi:MAG: hypothetical protein IJB32_02430 [Clostridia bacterium]|nr:hypothetical protein [Clostridia bacterium]